MFALFTICLHNYLQVGIINLLLKVQHLPFFYLLIINSLTVICVTKHKSTITRAV